jgi:hypothetical protein
VGLAILFSCGQAAADPIHGTESERDLFKLSERFRSFEPNYALWEKTISDDDALEARYSFRYRFFGGDTWNIFCGYAGEFDFYAGGRMRDSSPVVNRLNNPSFHLRRNLNKEAIWGRFLVRWWDLAFEHQSNGQVVDAKARLNDPSSDNHGRYLTQIEYEAGNEVYFDTISRGANFLSGEVLFKLGNRDDIEQGHHGIWSFSLLAKARVYLVESSEITWGPSAGRDVCISDYDRFRLILFKTIEYDFGYVREMEVGLQYTVGDKGLKTDSQDVTLLLSIGSDKTRIPLYIRAHFGPNDIFSDYARERDSIGFGFLLR